MNRDEAGRPGMSGMQIFRLIFGLIGLSFIPLLAIGTLSGYYRAPMYQWIVAGVIAASAFGHVKQALAPSDAPHPVETRTPDDEVVASEAPPATTDGDKSPDEG